MSIFDYISKMTPFVTAKDWDGLEREYAEHCRDLAGDAQARRIEAVCLTDYQTSLARGLDTAVRRATSSAARAVYFEYDLDNAWESAFFICPDYRPESAGDEDWACDYSDDVSGPDMRDL